MFQKQDGKIILTHSEQSFLASQKPFPRLHLRTYSHSFILDRISVWHKRFEFQGPLANAKTSNQSSWSTKWSDQELRRPSGIGRSSVPLLCNFYSFVLLEEDQAPCSWDCAGTTSGFWCLHLLIICRSNSRINEMKASLLFSHRFRL